MLSGPFFRGHSIYWKLALG